MRPSDPGRCALHGPDAANDAAFDPARDRAFGPSRDPAPALTDVAAGLASDSIRGAMSRRADASKRVDDLGTRRTLAEPWFTLHPACRPTQAAADAPLPVSTAHHLTASRLRAVTALVHRAAIDGLGRVTDPQTVDPARLSIGTVLGPVSVFGRSGPDEIGAGHRDATVRAVHDKVAMRLDAEVDTVHPPRPTDKVPAATGDGRRFDVGGSKPKGDPGNMSTRAEPEARGLRLGIDRHGATEVEMRCVIAGVRALAEAPVVTRGLE